jgi:hypothetical protein
MCPPLWGALSVRLVIERTIIVIVSILALLITLPLSAPILNLTACISIVNDVAQVMIVSATPSDVLLQWSDATS